MSDNVLSKRRSKEPLPRKPIRPQYNSVNSKNDVHDSFTNEHSPEGDDVVDHITRIPWEISIDDSDVEDHYQQTQYDFSCDEKLQEPLCTFSSIFYFIVIIVLICTARYFIFFESKVSVVYDEDMLSQDLNVLGVKNQVDDDSILQLRMGLTTISRREMGGSFIFVYDSRSQKFNPHKFNEFITKIAHYSAKFLRNDTADVRPIVIEKKDLNMNDYQDLMKEYREAVTKTGVMLVKELSEVPSKLAMAFHYYCDEYDPLIKKSAVLFTLNLDVCSPFAGQRSMHSLLEKCLSNKWKSLNEDTIGPLLTRVVSVVIDITK